MLSCIGCSGNTAQVRSHLAKCEGTEGVCRGRPTLMSGAYLPVSQEPPAQRVQDRTPHPPFNLFHLQSPHLRNGFTVYPVAHIKNPGAGGGLLSPEPQLSLPPESICCPLLLSLLNACTLPLTVTRASPLVSCSPLLPS